MFRDIFGYVTEWYQSRVTTLVPLYGLIRGIKFKVLQDRATCQIKNNHAWKDLAMRKLVPVKYGQISILSMLIFYLLLNTLCDR